MPFGILFFSIIFEKITNVMPIIENLQIHKYEKSPSVSFAFDVTAFFLETHTFLYMHVFYICLCHSFTKLARFYLHISMSIYTPAFFFLYFVLHTFSNHFLFIKT